MKPFKFSLHAVLVLREREEHKALEQYGKALAVTERAKRALQSVQEELNNAYLHLGEKLGTNCSSLELTRLQNYCQSVEWRLKECRESVEVALEQTQQVSIEMLTARQARVVLDKLLTREKGRYLRERRRREQKAIDDLPLRRPGLASFLEMTEAGGWN